MNSFLIQKKNKKNEIVTSRSSLLFSGFSSVSGVFRFSSVSGFFRFSSVSGFFRFSHIQPIYLHYPISITP
jgi:hypothetical protein